MNMITIIIPVYNGEKYLKNCLDNLLKIKCKKEIIVINDCSKDNSLDLLKKYKDKIKVINLKKNYGVSYARNLGIKQASGKYIGFVDVDDSIDLNMFDKMVTKIEQQQADVCVCNYNEIFEENRSIVCSKYSYNFESLNKEETLSKYLTDRISPAVWDKIYKKDLLKSIKFNDTLEIGEDILFCLNVFMNVNKVTFMDEQLYHYLQQNNSAMHNISSKLLQFKKVIPNIEINDQKYLECNFKEEFEFFELEMVTRGIHSISSLNNKSNKKQVIKFLKSYCNKDDLNRILKCRYFSKSIKLEMFLLKIFGIRFHLSIMPIYKFIRRKLR